MFQMFDIPVRSQSRNRTTLPLDFRAKLDTCFSSDATHPILSWDLSPAADGGKSKEQTVFPTSSKLGSPVSRFTGICRSWFSSGTCTMGLGIDPTNDYVFRLAFGDPANSDLLIQLLNAILELPSPIVDVEILNPFIEREFETDKLAILDIKARDADGRLLNVEMQKSLTPAFRERLVYLPRVSTRASCPTAMSTRNYGRRS